MNLQEKIELRSRIINMRRQLKEIIKTDVNEIEEIEKADLEKIQKVLAYYLNL
jgi:hypothetical protein